MIIMKKLTSLLIGCSLALAGATLAQQPVEEQSQSKNKRAPEKTHATEAQPKPNTAKREAPVANQHGAMKEPGAATQHRAMNESGATKEQGATNEHGAVKERAAATQHRAMNEPGAGRERKMHQESANAPATGTDVSGGAAGMPTHRGQEQVQEHKQGQGVKQPRTEAGATSATNQQNVQANAGAKAKKPDPQQVQQVKSQHASFRAQPKPQQIQPVTFNQNYRIQGSEQWQGSQYQVFRSYHPEWHDAGWYHSHYATVTLIAGGYYFFNNGYWFPAWGYNPSAQYYAYDGPIYVGQHAEPLDKVIADTQVLLQQMGYYKGEVDGLLGPLTREALTAYQADNGLTVTAAIDEPTLDTLGMS